MPGIVGLITKMPHEWAEPQLLQMVRSIRHETFYTTGTWMEESVGVFAGWAARKNSFSDSMPLRNERGDIVLLFSGEEYAEPGTERRLKGHGHEIKLGASDYLVHLAEEERAFPSNLNGRFHGLLINLAQETATLFNDRYGLGRIYYYQCEEAFYFAAEAKAILAVRPELRQIDAQGLGEFVSCGCVLENRTLFRGIYLLPPASAWTYRNGMLDRKSIYFEPREWENQVPLEPELYYEALRETFSQNLPRYFNGREPIGMSLTGGLDTRMIMAWQKSRPGALPCYSFGGTFRDSQDVVLSRKVAHACEQPYQVIPIGEDFLKNFARYAERTVYLTDGCAKVNVSSDLYANTQAAQIAPVRMTGNYGSEILRRLPALKASEPTAGLFSPELLPHVRAAQRKFAGLLEGHAVSFIAFRQVPWHHYGLLSLEQTQVTLRSPYLDNDLVRTAFRAPGSDKLVRNVFADDSYCIRLIADGDSRLARIRTDRGLAGTSGRLRSALCQGMLEFTFKAEYAYDYGMPQPVAWVDHQLSWLHLERLFLGRHKFNHFRIWYRDALSEYVREMLLDARSLSRPYLNREGVEAMVRDHLAGNRNYTSPIHQLLTLELIHRLFVNAN